MNTPSHVEHIALLWIPLQPSFVILSTMLSFACDAAKTFKSSMYSRFVALDPTGLESL